MGHEHCHAHQHHHHNNNGALKNIGIALILNLSFAFIEFFGAMWVGSVAVLADAVHDLGDSAALCAALILEYFARSAPSERYSYGYKRLSLLSAVLTSGLVIIGALLVLVQTLEKFRDPVTPHLPGMMVLAVLGVGVNGFAAWKAHSGHTENEKAISWHLMEDVLGWVAVLVSAVVMSFADVPMLDPLLSVAISGVTIIGAGRRFYSTTRLFLQGVPGSVDMGKLRQAVLEVDAQIKLEEMRLWSLDGHHHVLTMKVQLPGSLNLGQVDEIKRKISIKMGTLGHFELCIETSSQPVVSHREVC